MFSSDTIFLASFLEVSRYFRTVCHVLIHSGIINLLVALIPFPRLENALISLMISSQILKKKLVPRIPEGRHSRPEGAGESLRPVYLFLSVNSRAKNGVLAPGLYMP